MNIEIEKKFRVGSLDKVEDLLASIGGEYIKEIHGVDKYFVVPNNPEGRKYLRLRDKDGECEISYSIADSDTDTREWETAIGDMSIIDSILSELSFVTDVVVDKNRKVYKYKNSEIVLDEVNGLGFFVEVESPSLEELDIIAAELLLVPEQQVIGMGYPDLIRGKLISN